MKYKKDDAQKPVFIGTILYYIVPITSGGFAPQTPTAALPLDSAGGLPSPTPLLSRYTPAATFYIKACSLPKTKTGN